MTSKNIKKLNKMLALTENERNAKLHRRAVKYCKERGSDEEVLEIEVPDLPKVFKSVKEQLYQNMQILELKGTDYNKYFPKTKYKGTNNIVRLMIFDPIRYNYDNYRSGYINDPQKLEIRSHYIKQLQAYSDVSELRDNEREMYIMNKGFLMLTQNNVYRYVGYFIAVSIPPNDVIGNSQLGDRQMEIASVMDPSCSEEDEIEDEIEERNGDFEFLNQQQRKTLNTLLEEEEKKLSEFFGLK